MKRKVILGIAIALCLGGGSFTAYKYKTFKADEAAKILSSNGLIKDVYTDKSRYNPNDTVNFKIELNNKLNKNYKGILEVYFKHLNKTIEKKEIKVSLTNNEEKTIELSWIAPQEDYQGYLVEVYAARGISVDDHRNTAVDVSSTWDKFPRYGYLVEFPEQTKEKTAEVIDKINKFHINGLQFYDWQNEHQKPVPGITDNIPRSWKDIANRDIYFHTVKDYIDAAHSKNMKAGNYNLIYGAYADYEKDGVKPEWGIYKDEKHEVQDTHNIPSGWATSSLAVFNPSNKEWQNYIYNKEKNVHKVLNFDVFHMDTLGFRGNDTYDYNGNKVNIPDTYTDFINNAKKEMGVGVVFNTVNRYGLEQVAKSDVDFLYSELWPSDFPNYYSFKETVDKGYELTGGKKNTVIAAYMNYGRANMPGEFNEHSVRLTDAAIFASGGAHLELGDTGMLAKEYFPNKNLTMPQSLVAAMRSNYDFLVAYENLLRDGLKDINNIIELEGINTSSNGTQDTVWAFAKEKKGYEVVQMVNLLGMRRPAWRDDGANYNAPTFKKDLKLDYTVKEGKVKGVYLASPDINGGKSISLKYTTKMESDGEKLHIEVPELQYWNMVYIDKE
ncbi:glycoside hydrolase family 66 protein [Clostridium sp. YIM B02515]|uniref:Glycoside hydrolase family 66 protein n=1 Tax=Clostridium rhizosphaerae TaxID=2803861 RepID=A0ABS1TB06_9CLOT|nr:glycoside hydrolase family 66 protein [Clostridium rhizosphaerae]MBL4936543.1 glycoside hydrolase family 66 protein [Clostridium rhizosphaerae]